jgi:hypothetical protein
MPFSDGTPHASMTLDCDEHFKLQSVFNWRQNHSNDARKARGEGTRICGAACQRNDPARGPL